MTRFLTLLLCVLLAAPGCAMHQTRRAQTPAQTQLDDTRRAALGAFASQLPIGSQVRATVTGNHVVRGTLLKRTDQILLIQTRARVAEPLVEAYRLMTCWHSNRIARRTGLLAPWRSAPESGWALPWARCSSFAALLSGS